jgi:hypothetical protein
VLQRVLIFGPSPLPSPKGRGSKKLAALSLEGRGGKNASFTEEEGFEQHVPSPSLRERVGVRV